MSTFLELAQDLRSEAGLSGTGPAAVASQVGMDLKCVNWINDAWYEIQSQHDNWRWMWKNDGQITLVASQREYDLAALGFSVNFPIRDSLRRRVLNTPGTDMWLVWYEYEQFRETFLFGPTRYGIPNAVTISPAGKLLVDPVPDSVNTYELFFEYHERPSLLSGNSDTPGMPAKFHKMIVYRALMKYAAHDEATSLYQDAKANYENFERMLEREQLIAPVQGGTLA